MWAEMPIWWEYATFYPYDDEEDYDGVHDGGLKGISDDAPENVRKAYEEDMKQEAELLAQGIKI